MEDDWRDELRPRSIHQSNVDEMLVPAIAEILDVDEREAAKQIMSSPELYSIHNLLVKLQREQNQLRELERRIGKIEMKQKCNCCCRCCK